MGLVRFQASDALYVWLGLESGPSKSQASFWVKAQDSEFSYAFYRARAALYEELARISSYPRYHYERCCKTRLFQPFQKEHIEHVTPSPTTTTYQEGNYFLLKA